MVLVRIIEMTVQKNLTPQNAINFVYAVHDITGRCFEGYDHIPDTNQANYEHMLFEQQLERISQIDENPEYYYSELENHFITSLNFLAQTIIKYKIPLAKVFDMYLESAAEWVHQDNNNAEKIELLRTLDYFAEDKLPTLRCRVMNRTIKLHGHNKSRYMTEEGAHQLLRLEDIDTIAPYPIGKSLQETIDHYQKNQPE